MAFGGVEALRRAETSGFGQGAQGQVWECPQKRGGVCVHIYIYIYI